MIPAREYDPCLDDARNVQLCCLLLRCNLVVAAGVDIDRTPRSHQTAIETSPPRAGLSDRRGHQLRRRRCCYRRVACPEDRQTLRGSTSSLTIRFYPQRYDPRSVPRTKTGERVYAAGKVAVISSGRLLTAAPLDSAGKRHVPFRRPGRQHGDVSVPSVVHPLGCVSSRRSGSVHVDRAEARITLACPRATASRRTPLWSQPPNRCRFRSPRR